MTSFLLVGVLVVSTRLSPAPILGVGVTALAIQHMPLSAVPLGAGWLFARLRQRQRIRGEGSTATSRGVAELAEMTAVALAGGLGVRRSLELAAETIGGAIGEEADSVLQRMRIEGSIALLAAEGAAAPFYRILGRAALSGAPLLEPISRFAEHRHLEQAAARERAVRRLPVLMLFPLTLLILPGFVLLTVAPALMGAFARVEL